MSVLRWIWRDWSRAPISGTMCLMAQGMSGVQFLNGNIDRGLLWLILASIWVATRGPMEAEDEVE